MTYSVATLAVGQVWCPTKLARAKAVRARPREIVQLVREQNTLRVLWRPVSEGSPPPEPQQMRGQGFMQWVWQHEAVAKGSS